MKQPPVISLRASNRRQELDSDATLIVVEQFDTNNLGEVLMITAVTRAMIREGYQQAHTVVVMFTLGEEVKSLA